MSYIKAVANLKPFNKDAADIIMAILGDRGFESFMETETGFEAYIAESNYTSELLEQIETPFSNIEIIWKTEPIAQQNWNEEWEKHFFQPIVIDNRCVVRSPFHQDFPEMPIQIIIEPKMSFGTGHHETTSMMMQHILETEMKNKRVLDMGCGTGILGILASIQGAKNITAIDIDDWCTDNSKDNCIINNIINMEIFQGDASLLSSMDNFDVILANINRNILLTDIPLYAQSLNSNGLLILSGFYINDLPAIDAIANKHQLYIKSSKENNQWTAVAYEKK